MSSNGAVVFLRGVLGVKKTGHAGTLDPGACGVLPVCVGKATRISSYMMNAQKEYIAELTFGKSTDTADSYGQVMKVCTSPPPDTEAVKSALAGFTGQITQRTPAYSAAKHEGQALYKLARRGISVPAKQRTVVIHKAEYLRQTRAEAHLLRFVCSKGTYIRTLCEDLGKMFGTCSYMSFLVRTKCAGLDIADAYTADEIKQITDLGSILLPPDMFLRGLARIDVQPNCRSMLVNGAQAVYHGEDTMAARVYTDGCLIGIGCAQNGKIKITTLLVDN